MTFSINRVKKQTQRLALKASQIKRENDDRNDALKREPWSVSTEDLACLGELVEEAESTCAMGHELFVNRVGFFSRIASERVS